MKENLTLSGNQKSIENPLKMEAISTPKNLVEHKYEKSGELNFKIGETDVAFKYSDPSLGYKFKSFLEDRRPPVPNYIPRLDLVNNLRRINNFSLENNSGKYSVTDILPRDWSVYFLLQKNKKTKTGWIDFDKKVIILSEDPLTANGLLSLGHEIGHYEDSQSISEEEKSQRLKALQAQNSNDYASSQIDKDILTKVERNAWAHSLNDLRNFTKDLNISLGEIDDLVHGDCLQSYEDKILIKE